MREILKQGDFVVFVYPKMGKSGEFLPQILKDKAGLTGCSAQTKGYENLQAEFNKLGFKIIALSSQNLAQQEQFKADTNATFEFFSDEKFRLKDELGLKTFKTDDGKEFYFRQTLIFKNGVLAHSHEVAEPENDAKNTLEICKNLL